MWPKVWWAFLNYFLPNLMVVLKCPPDVGPLVGQTNVERDCCYCFEDGTSHSERVAMAEIAVLKSKILIVKVLNIFIYLKYKL